MSRVKVAILGGAGGVGASTAFNLALLRGPHEVVLVDNRANMLKSHVWDMEQVLEQSPGCTVREGDVGDVDDADVIVLLSATPLVVGTSRLEYLEKNALITDELADRLPSAWDGLILVVTNPVDPLVTRLQRRTGFDRRRILGYTVNDSLRLRSGLARALGVPPGSVEAWVLGEHGDTSVPLLDRVSVDGVEAHPTAEQAAAAVEHLRTFYVRHVALDSGRSSTWTSGLGVARMVSALDGAGELWPASVVLRGEYGIDGVAVTVPVTIGRAGAERIHQWELGPDQLAALHASAEVVRGAAARIL
jgi:malate dehydrogenase